MRNRFLALKATAAAQQWRTPWGDPDLQGIWSNAATTLLERPAALSGKQVLTGEETTELEKQTAQDRNSDRRDGKETDAGVARAGLFCCRGIASLASRSHPRLACGE